MDIKFDPKVHKKLMKLKDGIARATIAGLNETALVANLAQKKQIRKTFTLRTKWTEGSIFPKHGSRAGFIPEYKTDLSKVWIRTGSVQEYMERQQEGWTAHEPQVPTLKARVGRNYNRKIAKKARLKTLKTQPKWSPSHFTSVKKEDQVKQMIAVVRKSKYKGIIHVKKDGYSLPPGFYKMRNRRTLDLLRYWQKGSHKRKATHWHTKAMQNPMIFARQQERFNRKARIMLHRLGIK